MHRTIVQISTLVQIQAVSKSFDGSHFQKSIFNNAITNIGTESNVAKKAVVNVQFTQNAWYVEYKYLKLVKQIIENDINH